MPKGAPLDLQGVLLRDGRRLTLAVADGGLWQVDPPLFSKIAGLVGRRVRVIGVRGGFDLVDASRIYAI